VCIYLKNNPAKLHPPPIQNDAALDFLKQCHPNQQQEQAEKNE